MKRAAKKPKSKTRKANRTAKRRPSPTAGNGRDKSGRFVKGNRAGKGNPLGVQVQRLRSAMVNAVSVEDIEAIGRAMVKRARGGDLQACKLVLLYTLGRPIEADVIDRIEALEAAADAIRQEGGASWHGDTD